MCYLGSAKSRQYVEALRYKREAKDMSERTQCAPTAAATVIATELVKPEWVYADQRTVTERPGTLDWHTPYWKVRVMLPSGRTEDVFLDGRGTYEDATAQLRRLYGDDIEI